MSRSSRVARTAHLVLLLGLATGASTARSQAGQVAPPALEPPRAAPPTRDATSTAPPVERRPPPARPAEDDDDALLRKLEAEAEASEQKAKDKGGGSAFMRFIQSTNPDMSAILTLAGTFFYDQATRGKGGIAPGGGHDPGKTGMHFQELELAFQAAVDPYLRLDAFLSVALTGVHVEEAYFTTLGLPAGLQVRAGELYQKFGRFNQKHLHTWMFVDAVVPWHRLLGSEGLGGVSGEISWLMPLKWYSSLSFAVRPATGAESFVGDGARKGGFHVRHPGHLLYVLHLDQFYALSTNWGLSLGVSYAVGPNGSGGSDRNLTQLFGADLFLKFRPLRQRYVELQITTEFYGRLLQVPEDELFDWGLYAEVALRLSQRWWIALRYDQVQIADARRLLAFGFVEAPTGDYPRAIDDQHRASVAVTWFPTHFSTLRLQYNANLPRRSAEDGTPGGFRPSHEVLLQLAGNIGAHGAHAY